LLPSAPVLPARPHLAAAPNMPDTGTEPGNPGTIAAVPLPNAQTPLGTLACAHKHTHTYIYILAQYLLVRNPSSSSSNKITAETTNNTQQLHPIHGSLPYVQVNHQHNNNQAGFTKPKIYTRSYHTSNLLSNNSQHIGLALCQPTKNIYSTYHITNFQ